MQCGCPLCGTLTVHETRGMDSRCVCPACGWVCRDCLGDGQGKFTPLSRETVERMKEAGKNGACFHVQAEDIWAEDVGSAQNKI